MDRLTNNFLRRFGGDRFNLHAAFGARDHERPASGAVEEDREINLARDVDRLRDQDGVYEFTARPGLMGYERLPQHLPGKVARLLGGFAEMNATLEAVRESSLSAPARVDLGFDHQLAPAQILCRAFCLGGTSRRFSRRRGHPKFLEQLL